MPKRWGAVSLRVQLREELEGGPIGLKKLPRILCTATVQKMRGVMEAIVESQASFHNGHQISQCSSKRGLNLSMYLSIYVSIYLSGLYKSSSCFAEEFVSWPIASIQRSEVVHAHSIVRRWQLSYLEDGPSFTPTAGSVQVLAHGIEVLMVLTLIILK